MSQVMQSWIANITTAVSTIVIIVGLARRFLIKPFELWVKGQVMQSMDQLNKTIDNLNTTMVDHTHKIEELQREIQ